MAIFNRRIRQGATLHAVDLRVDEIVGLSILSGNHDERAWGADADRFDIRRFADPTVMKAHLGFGLGAHFCVGAPLARLSSRHGISALLEGTDDLELIPGWSYRKVPAHAINRPTTFPVRLRQRTGTRTW